MVNDLDNFYLQQPEPTKGCLLTLRTIILKQDGKVTAEWKYRMPFFCYKGKMFCYLWIEQESGKPYIGFVEGRRLNHPDLILGARSRMKVLYIEPDQDLPIDLLNNLLKQAIDFYRTGTIKIEKAYRRKTQE